MNPRMMTTPQEAEKEKEVKTWTQVLKKGRVVELLVQL